MKGYKYNTETEAKETIDLINQTLGIPVNDEATTRTYTTEIYDELGFWYIKHDLTIESILGNPIEFEITIIGLL